MIYLVRYFLSYLIRGIFMGRKKLHGLVGLNNPHPLYRLYYNIKTRCYNASKHNYAHYQGKGIKMCDRWLEGVKYFYEWAIENGWEKGLSIDRIDSNKDYCPENCRFISISENSKRNCKLNIVYNKKRFKHKGSKLTIENVKNIKQLLRNGIKPIEIAKQFNIDKSYISKIKLNKRWFEIQMSESLEENINLAA